MVCQNCGASVPEGKPFCGSCGSRMNAPAAPASYSEEKRQAAPPPPMFYANEERRPPAGARYSVMGVGSFLGTLLLMMIPVINLILLIVWACGGCVNQNKRNYSRAMLILIAIFLILDFALLALLISAGILTPDTFYDFASTLPA